MNALVVLAAALILPQEKNEAEELLRKSEKALASAVTLRFSFEGTGTAIRPSPPAGASVVVCGTHGTIELIRGNRVRLYGNIWNPEVKRARMNLVSDGKTTSVVAEGKPAAITVATPGRLNRDLVHLTLRLGAGAAIADTLDQVILAQDDLRVKEACGTPRPREIDPAKRVRISDLKMLGPEKLGNRETVMIQFTVTEGAGSDQPVVTLWLDAKSHLPVQRRARIDIPGRLSDITERYFDLQVSDSVEP